MPVIRMTDVTKLPDGKVLVDFDDGATLSFKNEQEMEDAYFLFTTNFIDYVKEINPELFNRALDYASTINRPQ